jgi:hypothetical protein
MSPCSRLAPERHPSTNTIDRKVLMDQKLRDELCSLMEDVVLTAGFGFADLSEQLDSLARQTESEINTEGLKKRSQRLVELNGQLKERLDLLRRDIVWITLRDFNNTSLQALKHSRTAIFNAVARLEQNPKLAESLGGIETRLVAGTPAISLETLQRVAATEELPRLPGFGHHSATQLRTIVKQLEEGAT